MEERLERVMEMKKLTMHSCFVLPITIRRDARQSCVPVRPPVMKHVQHVLTATHFSQVLDAVVRRVVIDMVELPIRKTTIVPSPDCPMHPDDRAPATEVNI